MKSLPYWCRGQVVKGFGRGSKQLGVPTANLPESVVEQLPPDVATGIYFGWACVGGGAGAAAGGGSSSSNSVHKMVMSIGWNPFYNNTKKSMEVHIIHSFENDFYGEMLSIVILGYIRPEMGFDSLEDLIDTIHSDIRTSSSLLDMAEYKTYQQHDFFRRSDLQRPSIPSA